MSDAFYGFSSAHDAVASAPAAHDIKALQRKTGRIKIPVTGGTAFLGAMFGQLLPYGDGAPGIRFQRGHTGRRRGRRLTQQARPNPSAALYWRSSGAIGGNFQHTRLGQQSATHARFG